MWFSLYLVFFYSVLLVLIFFAEFLRLYLLACVDADVEVNIISFIVCKRSHVFWVIKQRLPRLSFREGITMFLIIYKLTCYYQSSSQIGKLFTLIERLPIIWPDSYLILCVLLARLDSKVLARTTNHRCNRNRGSSIYERHAVYYRWNSKLELSCPLCLSLSGDVKASIVSMLCFSV